jgi:hypothetical protein
MEYSIVQRQFLEYPYKKQVYVYAHCLIKEAYELIAHLKPCILGSTFDKDVNDYLNKHKDNEYFKQ